MSRYKQSMKRIHEICCGTNLLDNDGKHATESTKWQIKTLKQAEAIRDQSDYNDVRFLRENTALFKSRLIPPLSLEH